MSDDRRWSGLRRQQKSEKRGELLGKEAQISRLSQKIYSAINRRGNGIGERERQIKAGIEALAKKGTRDRHGNLLSGVIDRILKDLQRNEQELLSIDHNYFRDPQKDFRKND